MIRTDEEREIAQQTVKAIEKAKWNPMTAPV